MVIPPSCVQSVEMRDSQLGLVGRNCCQTIISASPQSSQKGVASHRKGARNRPCLRLARTRPSAINWSSARLEGGLSFHWHLPLAVFGLGKQLFGARVALAIFLDDGLTKISRQHHIRAPGDNIQSPCAGRTDSNQTDLFYGIHSPASDLSDCVKRVPAEIEHLGRNPAAWLAQCCPRGRLLRSSLDCPPQHLSRRTSSHHST